MIRHTRGLLARRFVLASVAALLIAGCTGNGTSDDAADEATGSSPSLSATPSINGSSPAEVPTSSPTSVPPPNTTESARPSAPASQIDSCLLGRWRQTSMTSQRTFGDETVEAAGWIGRVLDFRPDGTEVVMFDDASPITAVGPDGQYAEEWRGVAVYQVSTSGDTLSFPSADFSDTTVVWQYGDQGGERQPTGTSRPVTYTCDDTTHTQRNETYRAEFTRISD